jgi:hypothetical protein
VTESPLFSIEPDVDAPLRKGSMQLRIEGRSAKDPAPYEELASQLDGLRNRLLASRVSADRVL